METEPGRPIVQYYSGKDYLAGSINWSVTQDHRGFMYFANGQGALEFDGANWTLIPLDTGGQARSIEAGKDGVVYVGGVGEFGYLASDEFGNTVYHSLSERLKPGTDTFSNVWTIHATSHGVYFVAHNTIFRWYQQQLEPIQNNKFNRGNTVGDDVYVFHFDGGVSRIRNGIVEFLQGLEFISSDNTGRVVVLPYSDNEVLIVTAAKGLFLYNLKTFLVTAFDSEIEQYLAENKLYYGGVVDDSGHYYLPTLLGGVVVINRKGELRRILNEFQAYEANGNSLMALSSPTWLFMDAEYNLWVSTDNGLYHVNLNLPWTVYDAANEARSVIIDAIRYDGHLYITSFKGVFYLPDYQMTIKNDRHQFLKVNTTTQQCFGLFIYNDHLLGLVQNKLYRIKGVDAEKLLEINGDPVIMAKGMLKAFPDHVFIGMNSQGFAAIKLNQQGGKVTAQLEPPIVPELRNKTIRTILGVGDKVLWIVTESSGLYKLTFFDDFNEYKLKYYGLEQGLPIISNNYLVLIENELLLYNHKGMYKAKRVPGSLNVDDVHFEPDLVRGGYFFEHDYAIYGVAQYGQDIFVKTNQGSGLLVRQDDGQYKWDTSKFSIIPNNGRSGNPSELMVYIEPDMTLWQPIDTTLYRLKPMSEKKNQTTFSASIRSVLIDNQDYIFNGNFFNQTSTGENLNNEKAVFVSQQPKWQIPNLNGQLSSIAFEYSGIFYEFQSKNQFSYMLENFDQDWSKWSTDTKKEYTNLKEGNYQFKVKSKNIYAGESKVATYEFNIMPPWYRTIYAYIVYALSVMMLVFAIVYAYSWRLVVARKKLEHVVKQRTSELEDSLNQLKKTQTLLTDASRRAGMSEVARSVLHNVGNALNGVKVSSTLLKEQVDKLTITEKLKNVVKLINGNGADTDDSESYNKRMQKIPDYLLALTEQATSSHKKFDDEFLSLQDNILYIERILDMQKDYVHSIDVLEVTSLANLISSALQISDYSEGDNIIIEKYYDEGVHVKLQRHKVVFVLMHLINNAVYALQHNGKTEKFLTIDVKILTGNRLLITVKDNGIGIVPEEQAKIFAHGYTTKDYSMGYGLHLSANAATEMGGKITVHGKGLGYGAQFVFELPFESEG